MTHTDKTTEKKTPTTPRNNWTDRPCYYVDATYGGKVVLLAGPFKTRDHADNVFPVVSKLAQELYAKDPNLVWYSWGTCKTHHGHRDGSMNTQVADALSADDAGEVGLLFDRSV